MGALAGETAEPENPDSLGVVVFLVLAMASELAYGLAGRTPRAHHESRPVRIDCRKLIVTVGNAEYDNCIWLGKPGGDSHQLIPGFPSPFLSFLDTVIRHFRPIPVTRCRASTREPEHNGT